MIKYPGGTWTREAGDPPVTHDGFYTFAQRGPGYWTVGASHVSVMGEIGPVTYVDYCVPSELPNARRRALRAARRIMSEVSA